MSTSNDEVNLSTIERDIQSGGIGSVGSGWGVVARPSRNNTLKFFMNEEDEKVEQEVKMGDVEEDISIDNLAGEMSSLDTSQSQTSQASGEEENSKHRERVLTDKYLAQDSSALKTLYMRSIRRR